MKNNEDWIDTNQGIQIIKKYGVSCTRTSLLAWIRKYHLGKKVGGRWYVDREQLYKFLKGEMNVY